MRSTFGIAIQQKINISVTEKWQKACNNKMQCNTDIDCSHAEFKLDSDCVPCDYVENEECQIYKYKSIQKSVEKLSEGYCTLKKQKRSEKSPKRDASSMNVLPDLITLYGYLMKVAFINPHSLTGPITELAVAEFENNNRLMRIPVYVKAKIYSKHLQTDSRSFNFDVNSQMEFMGQQQYDKWTHLLPPCLGGTGTSLNVIPMTKNRVRNMSGLKKLMKGDNMNVTLSTTYWRCTEDFLLMFLFYNLDGRVDWTVTLLYDENIFFQHDSKSDGNYRPTYIITQFSTICFNGTEHYKSAPLIHRNDDNYECRYREDEP